MQISHFYGSPQYLGVVVSLDLKGERRVEGDVVLGAGLDVDLLDQRRCRHNLVPDNQQVCSITQLGFVISLTEMLRHRLSIRGVKLLIGTYCQ